MSDKLAHTIPEAVAISGVSRSLIYDEINAGRLRARKAGRRTLILAADLKAWLEALGTLRVSA